VGDQPHPTHPKPKRRGPILLAAAIGVALLVATVVTANGDTLDNGAAPTPTTTPSPGPANPPLEDPGEGSNAPEQEPQPDPEPETVEVPELSGITRAGGRADPGRLWPQGDDQGQGHRPISCENRDLAVAQDRSVGASRHHYYLGGREGTASAAATAAINRAIPRDHSRAELRSVLSRRVP
jgi:hypothetical protein